VLTSTTADLLTLAHRPKTPNWSFSNRKTYFWSKKLFDVTNKILVCYNSWQWWLRWLQVICTVISVLFCVHVFHVKCVVLVWNWFCWHNFCCWTNIIFFVSQKTRPLRLIWHNFTSSQHLPIIFGRERVYSILSWLC